MRQTERAGDNGNRNSAVSMPEAKESMTNFRKPRNQHLATFALLKDGEDFLDSLLMSRIINVHRRQCVATAKF